MELRKGPWTKDLDPPVIHKSELVPSTPLTLSFLTWKTGLVSSSLNTIQH